MRRNASNSGRDGHPSRRARHLLVPAGMLILFLVLIVTTMGGGGTLAAPPDRTAADQLTVADVAASFRKAGLRVDDLRQQPVGGGPSGPPATEREAWAFSVPDLAPSGGRILVFADAEKLNKKAAWFKRAGAGNVLVHRNVILWLDPAMEGREVARYRQALEGLR